MIATPARLPTVGPYLCRELLGTGAGGQVWLADGPSGAVALKVAGSPHQRGLLRRESELLAWLDHPYLVRRVDADPEGAWLALEHVEGPTLTEWAKGRPLGQLVDLARQLSEAVAHLHDHDIVHGDLKPDNVLIDAWSCPHIIDLGCARVPGEPMPEGFHGTLGYAAPELLDGGEATFASDIYSLGALVYTLLTGRSPFGDRDPASLAWLPLSTLPEPPSSFHPRLPRLLDGLVLRMLARDPDARPDPASGLPDLFRRSLRSSPGTPVVGTRREREALRRMVVKVAEGEGQVVVVHGPEGSGRSALIREAVMAARREGFKILEGLDNAREALQAIRDHDGPTVVTAQGRGRTSRDLGARVLAERLPCLVLIESSGPMMTLGSLGARHLSPTPLTVEEVAWVLEAWGLDPSDAAELHAETGGRPGPVMTHVRSPAAGVTGISMNQRRLLEALAQGPASIERLAEQLGVSLHGVIDLAEPLLDRGLLVEQDEGALLATAPR
ncbi:MAG: serine/threonine-protein kinase PknK [Alphaproteobacteria bacterium]|nr:serine/threonine-protein kinase PknK [Alphaproteobacteria bacterium]